MKSQIFNNQKDFKKNCAKLLAEKLQTIVIIFVVMPHCEIYFEMYLPHAYLQGFYFAHVNKYFSYDKSFPGDKLPSVE